MVNLSSTNKPQSSTLEPAKSGKQNGKELGLSTVYRVGEKFQFSGRIDTPAMGGGCHF